MTIIIIVVTAIVSILAFQRTEMLRKLDFHPYSVVTRNEWHRMLTHGFLHGDYMHLIINMIVFYSFGGAVEKILNHYSKFSLFDVNGFHFIFLYLSSIVIASISSLIKHRKDAFYHSLGASGAVSAITFCFIFFAPWQKLLFFGIIPIPGIVFGVLYLIYTQYMKRKNADNINHDAHFWGAAYGFIHPIILHPPLFKVFLNNLLNP
jgi:membrane associated rhomboid family serine protease